MMMTNSLVAMPLPQLKRAIAIREQIDALSLELDELTGVSGFLSANGGQVGKSRSLQGAGKAAQQLRWTAYNGNGLAHGLDKKPRLSAEGRAKVSAAVKARWDRFRAAKAREARAK